MATTLRAVVTASVTGNYKNTLANTGGTVDLPFSAKLTQTLANGTSADQADAMWQSVGRSLNTGGSENIDVFDLGSIDIGTGAGEDPLGNPMANAEITTVIIINRSTSAGNIIIGGNGTAAAWNSMFNASDDAEVGPLGPGGVFLWHDPNNPALAVADSTNHLLKITEDGTGAVTYDILFLARSA